MKRMSDSVSRLLDDYERIVKAHEDLSEACSEILHAGLAQDQSMPKAVREWLMDLEQSYVAKKKALKRKITRGMSVT